MTLSAVAAVRPSRQPAPTRPAFHAPVQHWGTPDHDRIGIAATLPIARDLVGAAVPRRWFSVSGYPRSDSSSEP